jgi:hypothetical protein
MNIGKNNDERLNDEFQTLCGQMVDHSRDDLLLALFILHKGAEQQEQHIRIIGDALSGQRIGKI